MATTQSEHEQSTLGPEEMAPSKLDDIEAVRTYLQQLIQQGRAEQALELMALDPVAECTADNHSYGFRKKRCVHDAIGACYNALRLKGSPA